MKRNLDKIQAKDIQVGDVISEYKNVFNPMLVINIKGDLIRVYEPKQEAPFTIRNIRYTECYIITLKSIRKNMQEQYGAYRL